MSTHADYALVTMLEQFGDDPEALDIEWAAFVGDASTVHTFEVPTPNPTDAYIEIQAYDVGTYGHEIRINDEPLSGFDIPPGDGWQLWMDAVTGANLQEGENTIQIRRDTSDAFAIGNVVIHWRQPDSSDA